MNHELRTPLHTILGFAQLMGTGSPPPSPSQTTSSNKILKAGWHLLALVNEILDRAQIESEKVILFKEPVSLGEVMLNCRDMIEPHARKRDIRLIFSDFKTPCFSDVDRIWLKHCLINLLSNAIKYNRPGGDIAVECTSRQPDFFRINIRDTGIGFTPEQLAQLFQPFNRLDKEADAVKGAGIGLVVTKRLVELMGGTIGVESTVGVGSLFWMEFSRINALLPAVEETEHAPQVQPPTPDGK